ncbi:MAG: hypothetical protein ACREFQ_04570 [Stellaceae bacterium]
MRGFVLLACLTATLPAWVAPKPVIEVAPAVCASLTEGAAYVPSLSTTATPVAPADLSAPPPGAAPADLPQPPQSVVADTISVEIDPNIAGAFGIPATGIGAYAARPILGYVTVRNRRAYFNGKPLAPEAAAQVVAACRAVRK